MFWYKYLIILLIANYISSLVEKQWVSWSFKMSLNKEGQHWIWKICLIKYILRIKSNGGNLAIKLKLSKERYRNILNGGMSDLNWKCFKELKEYRMELCKKWLRMENQQTETKTKTKNSKTHSALSCWPHFISMCTEGGGVGTTSVGNIWFSRLAQLFEECETCKFFLLIYTVSYYSLGEPMLCDGATNTCYGRLSFYLMIWAM